MVFPDLSSSLIILALTGFLVNQVNNSFCHQPTEVIVREQDDERLIKLENAFKELAISESVLITGEINSLRKHIEDGGTWGKQKQKLQVQLKELCLRREAWSKAARYSGDLRHTVT
jgi:hypothetical protein